MVATPSTPSRKIDLAEESETGAINLLAGLSTPASIKLMSRTTSRILSDMTTGTGAAGTSAGISNALCGPAAASSSTAAPVACLAPPEDMTTEQRMNCMSELVQIQQQLSTIMKQLQNKKA